ncbi:TonB-dependent receptor [Gimibacter soli]|uniref:TonB-dependent receptor n=1 Tax=Gimibacter soli TaxID=3024400 RepID=A0AAF0BLI8_9PROT|nr:TonB-dependent receptor [Gimibacter soli]WCL53206.1 TonB-dependent receptor [Gimibacter soli]
MKLRSPDHRKRSKALLGLALCGITLPAAGADEVRAAMEFTIPSQPLPAALTSYVDQTGIGIVVDSRLIAGKTARAVTGPMLPLDALEHMLADSGLDIRRIGQGTVSLTPMRALNVDSARRIAPLPVAEIRHTAARDIPIEELLVIGERPPQFTQPNGHPVSRLNLDQISGNGYLTAADALTSLPMMESTIGLINSAIYGTATALSLVELRGLGAMRTLVLVNGKRVASTLGGNDMLQGTDLNSIPLDDIEQIEVIRGNSSAEYGEEAIGGVINFKLARDREGFSLTTNSGISQKGDRQNISGSMRYGTPFSGGSGFVSGSISYAASGGLLMSDRRITSSPADFAKDGRRVPFQEGGVYTPGFGGSTFTQNGTIIGYWTADGELRNFSDGSYLIAPDGSSITRPEGKPGERYNYSSAQSLVAPLERWTANFYIDKDIGSSAEWRLDAGFARSSADTTLAPLPLVAGTDIVEATSPIYGIDLDHPAIPESVRQELLAASGGAASRLLLTRRLVELGSRTWLLDRDTINASTGISGSFADIWHYDLDLLYSQTIVKERRRGLVNLSKLLRALDAEDCAAEPGCTPVHLFGANGISPEAAIYIGAAETRRRLTSYSKIASFSLEGNLRFLGRPTTLNTGLEYRHDKIKDRPESRHAPGEVLSTFPLLSTEGSTSVPSAWSRLSLSLIDNKPFVHALNVNMAARVSSQGSSGTLFSRSHSLDWQPAKGISVNFSYSRSERPPSTLEMFLNGPFGYDPYNDPCAGIEIPDNSDLAANCDAVLPTDAHDLFEQENPNTLVWYEGSTELEAEQIKSTSLGVDFATQPIWPDAGFQAGLSIDWYRNRLWNVIGYPTASDVLATCYQSPEFSHRFCGAAPLSGRPIITRDPVSGQVSRVIVTPLAQGRGSTEGVETELWFSFDTSNGALGNKYGLQHLDLSISHHYSIKVSRQLSLQQDEQNLSGTTKYPKHRMEVRSDLDFDALAIGLSAHIRGPGYADAAPLPIAAARAPWIVTMDLSARYRLSDTVTMTASVQNLFNKDAPFFAFSTTSGTSPEYYDVVGRRFSLGVRLAF